MRLTEINRSEDQAKAQFFYILEAQTRLEHCRGCEDDDCTRGESGGDSWANAEEYHNEDSAYSVLMETALSAEVVKHYEILLCTGGPAVRIIGDLDESGQPETAQLQHQDWGTYWTDYPNTATISDTLLHYAQNFFFEEG